MGKLMRRRRFGVAVLLASALALLVVVGCNDEDLNQMGAAGAHQTTIEVTAYDHWFLVDGAGGAGELAQKDIHAHNDVTFHVTNAGSVTHSFALYADAERQSLLVRTEPIPPGGSAEARFHFHDPQVAYFQDDDHADGMMGELHVIE